MNHFEIGEDMQTESSLEHFLRTGRLQSVAIGDREYEVREILGEPDATGSTSSKYKKPTIYQYRNLQLYFDRSNPQSCTGIYIESQEGNEYFDLPRLLEAQNWELHSFDPYHLVVRFLDERKISHHMIDDGETKRLKIESSNVQISFDEDELLYSISLVT